MYVVSVASTNLRIIDMTSGFLKRISPLGIKLKQWMDHLESMQSYSPSV